MIVEFVGPAAVGKSTISQELANRLSEKGVSVWVEPEHRPAWTYVTGRDLLTSLRYVRTLGLGWMDGFAREAIDLAVAQAALRQHRALWGVVMSQGVARDLWLSCRRHEVSPENRAQAISHLRMPDAVVLLNVPDEERKRRSTHRVKGNRRRRFSKKKLYRFCLPVHPKVVSVTESLERLESALHKNAVPALCLMKQGSIEDSASRIMHFLSGIESDLF